MYGHSTSEFEKVGLIIEIVFSFFSFILNSITIAKLIWQTTKKKNFEESTNDNWLTYKSFKDVLIRISYFETTPEYHFLIWTFCLPTVNPFFLVFLDILRLKYFCLDNMNSHQLYFHGMGFIQFILTQGLFILELFIQNIFNFSFYFLMCLIPHVVEARDLKNENIKPFISFSLKKAIIFGFLCFMNQFIYQVWANKLFLDFDELNHATIIPNFLIFYACVNYMIWDNFYSVQITLITQNCPKMLNKWMKDYLPNIQNILKWKKMNRVDEGFEEVFGMLERKIDVEVKQMYKVLSTNQGDRLFLVNTLIISVMLLCLLQIFLVLDVFDFFNLKESDKKGGPEQYLFYVYGWGVRPIVRLFVEPLSIFFAFQKRVLLGFNYLRSSELLKSKMKDLEKRRSDYF